MANECRMYKRANTNELTFKKCLSCFKMFSVLAKNALLSVQFYNCCLIQVGFQFPGLMKCLIENTNHWTC